jgi:hypothetical protein
MVTPDKPIIAVQADVGTAEVLPNFPSMGVFELYRPVGLWPVEEAFAIAFDYVMRTGQVSNAREARLYLREKIHELSDNGVTNKIRLANMAIHAFEMLPRHVP